MKWKRKPQECEGTYHFSGQFVVTAGIQANLLAEEILAIYNDCKKLVDQNNGIDYLLVYVHEESQQKLFFIDQLNEEMISSGKYAKEHNYCTLILAEEY